MMEKKPQPMLLLPPSPKLTHLELSYPGRRATIFEFPRGAWERVTGMTKVVLLTCLLLATSCDTLFGSGATNSEGNFDIDFELGGDEERPGSVTFDSDQGQMIIKAIPLGNQTSSSITVTHIVLSNNVCADFALYNVTDRLGQVAHEPDNPIFNIPIGARSSIFINVSYKPSDCIHTNYESMLYVYYQDDEGLFRINLTLKPIAGAVQEPPIDAIVCEEDPQTFAYTDVPVSGRPTPGVYYLRVERLRGFIYPSGPSSSFASFLGTDILDEPEDFVKPFLKITVAEGGNFTFHQLDVCTSFFIPSDDGETLFRGVSILLTTTSDITGTIDESGHVNLQGFVARLRAEDIPQQSFIHGTFQITLEANLTTEETAENEFLQFVLDPDISDEPNPLPLNNVDGDEDYTLVGTPLTDGKMTLVSAGTFTENDFIAPAGIQSALFNGEVFLFAQIDATVTTRNEGEGSQETPDEEEGDEEEEAFIR